MESIKNIKFAGLIHHGQHIFQRYIRHDAVVRAANVTAVFAQHTDALSDFAADIVGGSEGQGCLGGDPSEKGDVVAVFALQDIGFIARQMRLDRLPNIHADIEMIIPGLKIGVNTLDIDRNSFRLNVADRL